MQNIEKNLNQVRAQIVKAAEACDRDPDSVLLLAVSKRKPASDIRTAFEFGQQHFGENYLQEAQQKMRELEDLDICWHFIGAIQSNKTRDIATDFDWAHCIDRLKIARRASRSISITRIVRQESTWLKYLNWPRPCSSCPVFACVA
jgi:pyridoxal phosphate enzyme (YggS family)